MRKLIHILLAAFGATFVAIGTASFVQTVAWFSAKVLVAVSPDLDNPGVAGIGIIVAAITWMYFFPLMYRNLKHMKQMSDREAEANRRLGLGP